MKSKDQESSSNMELAAVVEKAALLEAAIHTAQLAAQELIRVTDDGPSRRAYLLAQQVSMALYEPSMTAMGIIRTFIEDQR